MKQRRMAEQPHVSKATASSPKKNQSSLAIRAAMVYACDGRCAGSRQKSCIMLDPAFCGCLLTAELDFRRPRCQGHESRAELYSWVRCNHPGTPGQQVHGRVEERWPCIHRFAGRCHGPHPRTKWTEYALDVWEMKGPHQAVMSPLHVPLETYQRRHDVSAGVLTACALQAYDCCGRCARGSLIAMHRHPNQCPLRKQLVITQILNLSEFYVPKGDSSKTMEDSVVSIAREFAVRHEMGYSTAQDVLLRYARCVAAYLRRDDRPISPNKK